MSNIFTQLKTIKEAVEAEETLFDEEKTDKFHTVMDSLILNGKSKKNFPMLCIEPMTTVNKRVASGMLVPYRNVFSISTFVQVDDGMDFDTNRQINIALFEGTLNFLGTCLADDTIYAETIINGLKMHSIFGVFEMNVN